MPACFGFLSSERRAKAVNFAKGSGGRLVVKLAGLSEVGFLIKVSNFKERSSPLASRRSKNGCIDQRKSAIIKEISNRPNDFMSHFQNRMLAGRPNPEMAIVHQKFYTMFFRGDWKGLICWNELPDLQVFDIQFMPARSRFAFGDFSHGAGDFQRRFLGQFLGSFKYLR